MQFLTAMVIIAQEEGTPDNTRLVLPEPSELIAGILAFAIVFFFVWKWAMPAINRTLEQRQAAIAGQIEDAEKAKVEAESLLADYRSQLAEARTEGNKIIEEARGTAEQMRVDLVARAEEEAESIRVKAREDADSEKARALSEARSQVGDISVDLAGRIVGDSLDADVHQDLIDRYLEDLERL